MIVPQQIRRQVTDQLQTCIDIAASHYDVKFDMPFVEYKVRGRTAGWAHDYTYSINLNSVLLMENVDSFIARTVVHEFAHLVDGIINPHTREGGTRLVRGRLQKVKRDIHGATWKSIMVLFGAPPSRCHSYDTTNSHVKRSTTAKHVWVCGCRTEMKLGGKRHNKMLSGATRYWMRGHSKCTFTYVGIDGQQDIDLTFGLAANNPDPRPTKHGSRSKVDLCRRVYDPELTRASNIVAFIEQGCTQAGAATYYAKIKKEFGS